MKLGLEDLDAIDRIERICFPSDPTRREDWIELLADERTIVFALKEDNIIKSYIAIYNWKGENDYIKIMSLGTHPDYRNRGYAHKIMQYTIDEMLKDGMRIFKAETRQSNIRMQKVFEDFGYRIVDKVAECYENPKEGAYKYSLEL